MRAIDADALIEKCGSWYVEEGTESGFIGTLKNLLATEPTIQPVATDTNVGDTISKFIDGLEEIFADLRERHVDDSVCGLCEYDGAYIGQSGDWCNECPGFERDDCFELSDKTRKEWTEEIIKALPTVQPEPTDEQVAEDCKRRCLHIVTDDFFRVTQPETHEGYWIDKGWNGDWAWQTDGRGNCWRVIECSECGKSVFVESNFCPHCGADMRGERKK